MAVTENTKWGEESKSPVQIILAVFWLVFIETLPRNHHVTNICLP